MRNILPCLAAAVCCSGAAALPAAAGGDIMKIRVASSGKQLHSNDAGDPHDSRLSTRFQTDDQYSRFVIETVAAAGGSGALDGQAVRIRVEADMLMLAATPALVSNATQDDGAAEHFRLVPVSGGGGGGGGDGSDGTYRIQCVATRLYWVVDATDAGFVSATAASAADGTVFSVAAAPGARCSGRADCSYNGQCSAAGRCVCAPQFQGEQCDQFAFAPYAGEGLRTVDAKTGAQTSSWGGSVLLDADTGKYHMWAAEMTESTGIKAWITNSQVVHAVADEPSGFRFERREVVQPVFAHEPTVSRAPRDGTYVMFYTTNYGAAPGSQCDPPCTCGANGTSCLSCRNDQQCERHESPLSTRMSHATSPDGPWTAPVLVPAPTSGDTNLACIIKEDDALVCMGRPGLGMLFADDWRNVSGYHWQKPRGSIHGEDPMLWVDTTDSSVLHAVTHGGGWSQPFGYHYWSADGGLSWAGTGNKVYQNVVETRGGGRPKILSRRERPHVVLGEGGALLALTNGVTEAWPCALQAEPDRPPCPASFDPYAGVMPDCGPGSNGTSIWCPIDYCYTMWQTFKTA